jgi:hypothetical protein
MSEDGLSEAEKCMNDSIYTYIKNTVVGVVNEQVNSI